MVLTLVTDAHSSLAGTVIVAATVGVAVHPCPPQVTDALIVHGARAVAMDTSVEAPADGEGFNYISGEMVSSLKKHCYMVMTSDYKNILH